MQACCVTQLARSRLSFRALRQVRPGLALRVQGEPGAVLRGSFWGHGGASALMRGVECRGEGAACITLYGGRWLLDDCRVCVSPRRTQRRFPARDGVTAPGQVLCSGGADEEGDDGAGGAPEALGCFGQSSVTLRRWLPAGRRARAAGGRGAGLTRGGRQVCDRGGQRGQARLRGGLCVQ